MTAIMPVKMNNKKINLDETYIGKSSQFYVSKAIKQLRERKIKIGQVKLFFERKFAKFLGVKHSLACSSGTMGIIIALLAVGVKQNDEVIVSPLTHPATLNAIYRCGAKPVFPKIDTSNGKIITSSIEQIVSKNTKAFVIVHLLDVWEDIQEIMRISKIKKIHIIEDACQSLGAKFKGKMLGTFGEAGVYSFGSVKPLTTLEGGMVVTDNPDLYEKLRSNSTHGFSVKRKILHGFSVKRKRLEGVGYSCLMNDLTAALGIANLEEFEEYLQERKTNFKKLNEILDKYSWTKVLKCPDEYQSNYAALSLKVNDRHRLKKLVSNLNKIGLNASLRDASDRLGFYILEGIIPSERAEEVKAFFENTISLPTHFLVDDATIEKIKGCFDRAD